MQGYTEIESFFKCASLFFILFGFIAMESRSNRLIASEKAENDSNPENSPSVGDPVENRKGGRKRNQPCSPCNVDGEDKKKTVNNGSIAVGGRVSRSRTTRARGDINITTEQTRLETAVNRRPKRHVGHPASLQDFYVEPVLKLTRQVKPKPKPQQVLTVRLPVYMMFARENYPERRIFSVTNNQSPCNPSVTRRLLPRTTEIQSIDNRKRNLLTWMIESGVIRAGGKLRYAKHRVLEGVITVNGVVCNCCRVIMSLSYFTYHAGGNPGSFNDIYVESGKSFLECLIISWTREASKVNAFNFVDYTGDNFSGDTCDTCGDGGTLICCGGCPSMFHRSCVRVKKLSSGIRYCVYCLCKFCGTVADQMSSCSLCDEKFHKQCRQVNSADVESGGLFCGEICKEIYERLQELLGVKHGLLDGFSFTLLRRSDLDQDSSTYEKKIECNSKLAVAYTVMNECFDAIVDKRTGVDMIRNVVYNCRPACICKPARILRSLGVPKLVIPATPDLHEIWTNHVFRFKPLKESTRQTMKSMSMVVLPGTNMLQKRVPQLVNDCSSMAFALTPLSPSLLSSSIAADGIKIGSLSTMKAVFLPLRQFFRW
ncbi:hypothetical protein L2E82_00162 [Cichorium intybus]|uniref:Uncharacterized protein n=1 Tax=Cichorium intybus TaxID=13427 RepID=A0ACB9GW43_CICIN|nr:hypothetical protein L2E82_00162 [Cichorium intybus]